jgi:hypothetical protein
MLRSMTTTLPERRMRLRQSITPFLTFFEGPFARLNLEPDIATGARSAAG